MFVRECRDFGPKDRGSSSLGFIAHDCLIVRVLPVLLLFRLSSREKNGKRRFETLRSFAACYTGYGSDAWISAPECLCK